MIYVILPAYNEEKVIRPTLLALVAAMRGRATPYRAVLVDDGRRDRTAEIARELGAELVNFDYDGGWPKKKNWAIRNLPIRTPWFLILDRFNLSNPTGDVLGTRWFSTVTIKDNDPGIQVEFANYWARENSGTVVIAVTRGLDENWPATVDYTTENVSAIAGQDYTATNGTLSFAVGEYVRLLPISILNDGLKEATETFRLTLSNATGGSVLGTTRIATVNLEDSDPGVQFTLAEGGWFTTVSNWVHESEGMVRMAVTRGNDGFLDPFTVEYATVRLTAMPGVDFTETNGVLEFAAGEMLKFISIQSRRFLFYWRIHQAVY